MTSGGDRLKIIIYIFTGLLCQNINESLFYLWDLKYINYTRVKEIADVAISFLLPNGFMFEIS